MRFAIFSDVHANLEALQQILKRCESLDIDAYLFLGDLVGYNANPKECIEIVRSLPNIFWIKGNHDEFVANPHVDIEQFNAQARAAVLWTRQQLSDGERDFLFNMPMRYTLRKEEITLVHATLNSPASWGYIFDIKHAADHFDFQFTNLCFCGHSHVPAAFRRCVTETNVMITQIPGWNKGEDEGIIPEQIHSADNLTISLESGFRYLFNVGSVGQPRNRDPRASFAVYDTDKQQISRYRVPYPVELTKEKILRAGLPERLAARLDLGN